MNDDRIVKLLEEIRDLQRQHVENYKDALRNQEESIKMNREWQRKASQRQLIALIVLAVVVASNKRLKLSGAQRGRIAFPRWLAFVSAVPLPCARGHCARSLSAIR